MDNFSASKKTKIAIGYESEQERCTELFLYGSDALINAKAGNFSIPHPIPIAMTGSVECPGAGGALILLGDSDDVFLSGEILRAREAKRKMNGVLSKPGEVEFQAKELANTESSIRLNSSVTGGKTNDSQARVLRSLLVPWLQCSVD